MHTCDKMQLMIRNAKNVAMLKLNHVTGSYKYVFDYGKTPETNRRC